MSTSPYDIDRDLREAKALADGLIPYLYESALYGSVRTGLFGGGNMPALTIGAVLLRLRRLRALADRLSAPQREQLSAIERTHDNARAEWRQHYGDKLNQEALSRLKAMATFFDECEETPRQCAGIYPPEVLRRTIVQEIKRALEESGTVSEELTKELRRVDGKLRRFAQPAPFLWHPNLEAVYPPTEFWWLYAHPPIGDRESL